MGNWHTHTHSLSLPLSQPLHTDKAGEVSAPSTTDHSVPLPHPNGGWNCGAVNGRSFVTCPKEVQRHLLRCSNAANDARRCSGRHGQAANGAGAKRAVGRQRSPSRTPTGSVAIWEAPDTKCPGRGGARRSAQHFVADLYMDPTMVDHPTQGLGEQA